MSYKRRDFLKTASVMGSGLVLTSLSSKLTGCKPPSTTSAGTEGTSDNSLGNNLDTFGLQLYTLREDFPKDPKGVLQQVASFGYNQVEGYEGPQGIFWGMTNKEMKTYLDSIGLTMISSHCNTNEDFERKADQAAEIGLRYLLNPYLGPQKTLDDYKRAAEQFNRNGEICKQRGMRFGYHNHDYSFTLLDGQYPQDVMMQNTSPDLVDYEMDIYWVVAAGQDPVEWMKKYPNRFRLGHVKDRRSDAGAADKDASVVLGTGNIDYPGILSEAKRQGMAYFIVEQERYDNTTPLQAAKEDAEYMKKLKI